MFSQILRVISLISLISITIFYIINILLLLIIKKINTRNRLESRSIAMQSDKAKYIKKRWKGGVIEPHPTENALIINYKLKATIFDEPGSRMFEESKDCQRIIRLKSLNMRTDVDALAAEVASKCDIIHETQLKELQQIIYYLKKRSESGQALGNKELLAEQISQHPFNILTHSGKAKFCNIDEYIELLYEDMPAKLQSSSLLLELALHSTNLERFEKNEAALSALSRVLREDWRKSLDLSTNIVYIFFCFSAYSCFHNVIIKYKIGSLCMDIIDYELKRFESMQLELESKKISSAASLQHSKSTNNLDTIINMEKPPEMEPPRRRIPELKQRPKSGNWSSKSNKSNMLLSRSYTLNSSNYEELSELQPTTVKDDQEDYQTNDINITAYKNENDCDKLNKQLRAYAKKQEQLLRVSFYLLLNIAENTKFEEKMRRRGIIKMLVKVLERPNVDLLILALTFIKKLTIIRENKNEMKRLNLIEILPNLLKESNSDLLHVTLKVIYNLSFDGEIRFKMVQLGILPKLISFLSEDKHHEVVTRILYLISMDDKTKLMFAYTECVPLVVDMLILNLDHNVDVNLIALCINLALNKENAQLMVQNNRLRTLMARAFKYEDILIMKLLRNISAHKELQIKYLDFVGDLAQVITISDDKKFIVECIGVLGNLHLSDLDYSAVLQHFQIIPWIRKTLMSLERNDDLILNTIIFLGTCASDESCAMFLCRADIISFLIDLLKVKQEDDEIVLQITYIFQEILRSESTREFIIKETETPAYLIDLMHDKNPEIRRVCEYCLDIIAISDSEWAMRIKLEKFRSYNAQWLTIMESQNDLSDNICKQILKEDDDDISTYTVSNSIGQNQLLPQEQVLVINCNNLM